MSVPATISFLGEGTASSNRAKRMPQAMIIAAPAFIRSFYLNFVHLKEYLLGRKMTMESIYFL